MSSRRPEARLQAACVGWCRENGYLAVNVCGSGWSLKGFPDLLVFGDGRCCAVELKAGTGYKLQDDQKVWAHRFEAAGIPWGVPETLEGFASFVEGALHEDER